MIILNAENLMDNLNSKVTATLLTGPNNIKFNDFNTLSFFCHNPNSDGLKYNASTTYPNDNNTYNVTSIQILV